MKVAIIPARGGSKRIPKKNIRNFHGKPIISYSIRAALESSVFDRVIVSTEDPYIAQIALQYGAEVPFVRPKDLSDDFSGTGDVVKHAVSELGLHEQDPVCCIYPTAPFVTAEILIEGYKKLVESGASYVFSATRFTFPPQRALVCDANGKVHPLLDEFIHYRSQDLEETVHDAGQFYWGLSRSFLDDVEIFSEHSVALILPRYHVMDLDTEDDWIEAELMYNAAKNRLELDS